MNQWHNCPNLAAFWYNIISAVLYLYGLYTSGARYHSLRAYMNDPRYGQDWDERYLLLYLAAILISSLFWLLFLFSSLFKTGNLANDYIEMSTIRTVIGAPHISWSGILICKKILSRLRYHLIPLNATMHLCGAFFLLVPIPLIVDQEIKHDILNSDNRSINALLTIYTPEIINFLVAAISVTVRLPTVFLTASTPVSIIFSFMLFISNSNILIRSLLHQLFPFEGIKYDIVCMEIVDMVIFFLILFNNGFIYEMARTRYIDLSQGVTLEEEDLSTPKSGMNRPRWPPILRFWPNVFSANTLVVVVILSIHQYRLSTGRMPLFFFDLTVTVFHYLVWLTILLLFTFKTDWRFKLSSVETKRCLLIRETSLQIPHLNLKQQADSVYTCFQQIEGVRSASVESSRTPNQDFSSASSSSGSHNSERVSSYKHIPSISKQLEAPELNYEDLPSYKYVNRQGRNFLKEITEENVEHIGYFKSPNISQRSSNIHSSDSGIGINYRDHPDYHMLVKTPDCDIPRSRSMNQQRRVPHEMDINEEQSGTINIYSDV